MMMEGKDKECCIRFCSSRLHVPLETGTKCKSKVQAPKNGIKSFMIPKDAGYKITLEWIQRICSASTGQTFDPLNDAVCPGHFKDDCFQRVDTFLLRGKKYSLPKAKISLKPGSVPSIFDTPVFARRVNSVPLNLSNGSVFEAWYRCQTCKCFIREKDLQDHIQKVQASGCDMNQPHSIGHRIAFVGRSPVIMLVDQLTEKYISNHIYKAGKMQLRRKPRKVYVADEEADDGTDFTQSTRSKNKKTRRRDEIINVEDFDSSTKNKRAKSTGKKKLGPTSKQLLFDCLLCVSPTFDNQTSYSSHMKSNHMVNNKFQCPHCPYYNFTRVIRLKKHYKRAHMSHHSGFSTEVNRKCWGWKPEPFICDKPGCDFKCRREVLFEGHMKKIHNKKWAPEKNPKKINSISWKKRFKCPLCDSSFCKRDCLKRHVHVHLRKMGIVPDSKPPSSSNTFEIKKEIKQEPSEESPTPLDNQSVLPSNEIPTFEKISKWEVNEEPHTLDIQHPNQKYMEELQKILAPTYKGEFHACHLCPNIFKQVMYLKRHVKVKHGVSPKEEKLVTGLVRSSSSGSTPKSSEIVLSCGTCGFTSKDPSELQVHIKSHVRGRNFNCRFCGINLSTAAKLEAHIKLTHKTRRDFVCSNQTCKKAFPTSRRLVQHKERVHKNKKPIKCDKCSKIYLGPLALQQHVKWIHSDRSKQRPICQICGEKRANNHSLRRHVRRVHVTEMTVEDDVDVPKQDLFL